MAKPKPSDETAPTAETKKSAGPADEFVIGEPEFRIGETEFRIGDPNEAPPTEFRIGTPDAPTESPARPPLPAGWRHVPPQPPWRSPDTPATGPPDDLQRIENPKKRYRGLAALKAYLEPDHVEEIIDMLVYRAREGRSGPRTISDFIAEAVRAELDGRRQEDQVGDRYPDYASTGIKLKRGTRTGRATRTEGPQRELRPVVARLREGLVHEVRDSVIHRNGGQPEGAGTISGFVGDAVLRQLQNRRMNDGVTDRYPPTTPSARKKYLDPRTTRPNR